MEEFSHKFFGGVVGAIIGGFLSFLIGGSISFLMGASESFLSGGFDKSVFVVALIGAYIGYSRPEDISTEPGGEENKTQY